MHGISFFRILYRDERFWRKPVSLIPVPEFEKSPRMRVFNLFCLLLLPGTLVIGQTYLQVDPNDLQGGGDTRSTGNNCFRLTTARDWESGTVWYRQAVDLTEPFEMEMNLGAKIRSYSCVIR